MLSKTPLDWTKVRYFAIFILTKRNCVGWAVELDLETYRKMTQGNEGKAKPPPERISVQEYRALMGMPSTTPTSNATGKPAANAGRVEIPNQEPLEKRNKYGARKKLVDGIWFDSVWESQRYLQLKAKLHCNEISNLELQVKFPLEVNGVLVASYVADFVYENDQGTVVEDAKGYKTAIYRLKKKLMKACYDIDIYETTRPKKGGK